MKVIKYNKNTGEKNIVDYPRKDMKPIDKLSVNIQYYGIVKSKLRANKPFWPQELGVGVVLWPLSMEFEIGFCLTSDRWESERIRLNNRFQWISYQRALQQTKDGVAQNLLNSLPR